MKFKTNKNNLKSALPCAPQMQGPTLAQLNSPVNEEPALLRGITDFTDLSLDLDALTNDVLSQTFPIKVRRRLRLRRG